MYVPVLAGRVLSNLFFKPPQVNREHATVGDYAFYSTPHFHNMLRTERKRTERSKKPFLLMLLDLSGMHTNGSNGSTYEKIKPVLASCSRDTDIQGWYEHNKTIGTIFTEMSSVDEASINRILNKLHSKIGEALDPEEVKKIKISFHVFPEGNGNSKITKGLFNISLYPDLSKQSVSRQATSSMKKLMDITGSLLALLCFAPLLLIIAAAVKLTSK